MMQIPSEPTTVPVLDMVGIPGVPVVPFMDMIEMPAKAIFTRVSDG